MSLSFSLGSVLLVICCSSLAQVPASTPTHKGSSPRASLPRHRQPVAQVEQTPEAAAAFARQPLRTRVVTPQEVAWALTSPFASQRLQAWSIYVWLMANITYDRNVYTAQRAQVQIAPADVLRCRKTSCEGYARLVNELCAAAGIEAVKVVGIAKGGGNANERHAWNLVRLDGQWAEVDATWGSSFQSPFYFAPDPELFKWSHYALDPCQQLSQERLTRAEFDAQDGLRGDSDPWWREWRQHVKEGKIKRFNMRLH